ncbi:acyltransferase family protein [Kribbia dieselivorans]|uniref:acyltransferase family protein n=1 Tax=Kribbia dieselivorans TaxID=331526 RepID=UPI00083913D9|nr:acyltransferase [Kribbia dieselivorans]
MTALDTATADASATSPPGAHRGHLPGLDGLRALGAFAVVTTHVGFHSGASLTGVWAGMLSRLDIGVALFFVLSGFLLFRPHVLASIGAGPRPNLRRYAIHRVLRIVPALWVTVALAWLLVPRREVDTPEVYVATALFTQIYRDGLGAPGLTQMWSLSVEWSFYVALPLLAWLLLRRSPTTPRALAAQLAVLLALPVASATYMALPAVTATPLRGLWLPGYLGWFALGMALALWQVARSEGLLRRTHLDILAAHPWTAWGCAGALYLVLTTAIAGPYGLAENSSPSGHAIKSLLYGVFAALVVLPAVGALDPDDEPGPIRALGRRGWRFLGDISYGIFCYHLIVLSLVERAVGHEVFTGGFWKLWILTALGTTVVAAVSYRFMERPIMRWGRRISG